MPPSSSPNWNSASATAANSTATPTAVRRSRSRIRRVRACGGLVGVDVFLVDVVVGLVVGGLVLVGVALLRVRILVRGRWFAAAVGEHRAAGRRRLVDLVVIRHRCARPGLTRRRRRGRGGAGGPRPFGGGVPGGRP